MQSTEIPPPCHQQRENHISLHSLKRRVERRYEVLRLLGTDRKTDGVRLYALIGELSLGQLRMRRARGVDHKRLHVSDIREERENREVVDELLCRLRVALYLEREDRTASIREILLIERMARLRLKRRVMDSLDLRIFVQIIDDLERVLDMALDSQ